MISLFIYIGASGLQRTIRWQITCLDTNDALAFFFIAFLPFYGSDMSAYVVINKCLRYFIFVVIPNLHRVPIYQSGM